ncbi:hypothetical protein R1flu_015329 [Riccia fluitans]|uniref:C2H2-type domain-containing protein n=1 Tax=Riccia fluitans TaxID=41844 RepID=A0ABD1YIV6_9MARC
MVGCRESQASTTTTTSNSPPSVKGKEPVKELLQTETSCVIDGDATDVDDTEMTESNAARGGGLTARRVREEGKKPEPSSQHRSSPDRNYSQAADSEKSRAVTWSGKINRRVDQTGHPLIHRRRHTAATPAAAAMGSSDLVGPLDDALAATASAEAGMDVDFDEAHDEVLQVGKETPRYDEDENLDSSPDYALRPLANSRHICKVCSREFPSGRALGGHMRAHGSGDPTGILANQQQLNNNTTPSPSPRASASHVDHNGNNEPNPDAKPSSVLVRAKSTSPESRARARSQREILHNRRSADPAGGVARRSNSKARPPRERTITPKSSVEDVAAIIAAKHEHDHDDDNVVSNRDHASSEPAPSSSSSSSSEEDGNSDGGNEIAENVCDVCSEEFENGKQLHSHKKSHEVYALRSNPKRSRRFIDQDYTECPPPNNVPTKKQGTTTTSNDDCACPYPECPKRFPSLKALFGHMRCHPDRTWRGIHPPTDENGPNSGGGDRQHQQQRRKKVRPSSNPAAGTSRAAAAREVAAAATASSSSSDSEPEPEEHVRQNGKSPVSEEIESDTESIEAAYMNGEAYMTEDRHQATSTTGWWGTGVTGKRSKRSRQSVRSVHLVHAAGGSGGASCSRAPAPPDTAAMSEELNAKETAEVMIMMMNSGTKIGQKLELDEVRRGFELSIRRGHNSGVSPRRQEERAAAGDEMMVEGNDALQDVEEFCELREVAAAEDVVAKDVHDEWKPMDLDRESVSDEGEEEDEKEDQLEEASTSKAPKYQCNTCKRSFRSHQALGGHRASHKKVKGCFARTNVGELESHEEETSDEVLRSEEQLPTELNDVSHSDGDDKDRQLISVSKDESSTADIVVHPSGAAGAAAAAASTKKGAHRCTECGRCFDSGQALGGHKRCHFDPTKKDGDKENSSSNNGGKNQRTSNPAGRASSSQGRFKMEGAEGRGNSPRVRNSELGLQLQQAAASQPDLRTITGGGERVLSAQVLRPVKPLDLNLPAPVNDEEEDEMPRNGYSPSGRGSQIENKEPNALANEICPADDERSRSHVEYHFAALLPPLGYQPFECSQCGQRFFSHDALTQHAATPHKKDDQMAMGSFIKRIMS